MNPEIVSVTRSSLGWLRLTTRTLRSWTGRSLVAPSSRASRSTSCRISQDTAISTGISRSSPRSAGGRIRSLRTSVFACAAMSLTIFCSSEAATAGVADVRKPSASLSNRVAVDSSSALIAARRAISSRFCSNTCSRAGTSSPADRLCSRIGSITSNQPPRMTPTAMARPTRIRSRRERLPIIAVALRVDGTGIPAARPAVTRCRAATRWRAAA